MRFLKLLAADDEGLRTAPARSAADRIRVPLISSAPKAKQWLPRSTSRIFFQSSLPRRLYSLNQEMVRSYLQRAAGLDLQVDISQRLQMP